MLEKITLHKSILNTAKLSLYIQYIVFILLLIGLLLPIKKYVILKEIMYIEIIVQIVEILFYSWLVHRFYSLDYNITSARYFDWFISTPFMLLIIIFFMEYNNNKLIKMFDIIYKDYLILISIIVSNFFMLLFGYLGEIKKLNKYVSFLFGFLFFTVTYSLIFTHYFNDNRFNLIIILCNCVVWSIYGFAFLFPFTIKNNIYNILDIFSKNITAVFIFIYTLYNYI